MKKGIIITMCLLLLSAGVPVYTDAKASDRQETGEVTPCYTYLSSVLASISIEKGYAKCTGNLMLFASYTSSITLTLQRSKDGVNWSNVKSWSQDFTGSGSHSLEDGYYVNSGYIYRVKNVSKVKNGSTVLETATVYSSEISY
jgi:hypothetical protein